MSKLDRLIKEFCPDGVEYKAFFEIADFIRGVTYSKELEVNSDNGTKLLRANNITLDTNKLNFDDVKIIDRSVKIKSNQWLKQGDILICAGSGSKDHIGKTTYIFTDMDYTFGGFMAVIRTKGKLHSRLLFHVLTSDRFLNYLKTALNVSTINNLNTGIMKGFMIPLPPLPVQEEIVRILDSFTMLQTELQTELQARIAQYEFYRDFLLNSDKPLDSGLENLTDNRQQIRWTTLNEIAEIGTGSSNTNEGLSEGAYPFFVRSLEVRYKDEYEFDETAIITSGDGVGVGKIFHFVQGKYALHQRAYRIKIIDNTVDARFFYYYMKSNFCDYIRMTAVHASVTSIRKPMLDKYPVPVPPLAEQKRIVAILDKFSELTSDLTDGLPAEIEARRKQYEYYRNKLLDFKEIVP